jgi:hypothetical protein
MRPVIFTAAGKAQQAAYWMHAQQPARAQAPPVSETSLDACGPRRDAPLYPAPEGVPARQGKARRAI